MQSYESALMAFVAKSKAIGDDWFLYKHNCACIKIYRAELEISLFITFNASYQLPQLSFTIWNGLKFNDKSYLPLFARTEDIAYMTFNEEIGTPVFSVHSCSIAELMENMGKVENDIFIASWLSLHTKYLYFDLHMSYFT